MYLQPPAPGIPQAVGPARFEGASVGETPLSMLPPFLARRGNLFSLTCVVLGSDKLGC